MTWKQIFKNKDFNAYVEKAEKQKYVYVLYSTKAPYLPIDFAYSLEEIAIKYPQSINNVIWQYYHGARSKKYGYTIEMVHTEI